MANKNQDWIGNGKSVFRAIAASNHSNYEREPTDFYATDPKALEIFLATIKRDGFILPHKVKVFILTLFPFINHFILYISILVAMLFVYANLFQLPLPI